MEYLYETSYRLIQSTSTELKRYLYKKIDWNQRLIGILGARGTGKTTLILQHLKLHFERNQEALYVSVDRLILLNQSIYALADEFYKMGGKVLFLDEVHKYPGWALELKNIYDEFPSLKLVFTGSSALLLHQAEADLSRRASMYHLHNLSFREFIKFRTGKVLPVLPLDEILKNHTKHAANIGLSVKILPLFNEYLINGAYPYYFENGPMYLDKVRATVRTIVESDLMALSSFGYSSIVAMQKVLSLIAQSVPFKPNVSELSRKTGVARDILLKMMDLLVRADLLISLRQDSSPTGYLTKPEKLYLQNPSLVWALSLNRPPEIGTLRETFVLNQLSCIHCITLPKSGDFMVNDKHTLEIGGVNTTKKQISRISEAYVVKDGIETGYGNIIPLWLFGFLY